MKKIILASGLLALMAAATSCDKYNIYDEQFGDIMMIKDGGEKEVTFYSTDEKANVYISVMKGGHNPEAQSSCKLRLMNNDDFKAYYQENYGAWSDEGNALTMVPQNDIINGVEKPLYRLIEKGKTEEVQEIAHNFSGANDRYFGANLVVYSENYADWFNAKSDAEKNATNYVIPVGLYSSTDSVNTYGKVMVIKPNPTNPTIKFDVNDLDYNITELGRVRLITNLEQLDETKNPVITEKNKLGELGDFADMPKGEGKRLLFAPEVYVSVPCQNPWGMKIRFEKPSTANAAIDAINKKTNQKLVGLKYTSSQHDYSFMGNTMLDKDGNECATVELKPGETKARLPLWFDLNSIDPNADINKLIGTALTVKLSKANPSLFFGNGKEIAAGTAATYESIDEAKGDAANYKFRTQRDRISLNATQFFVGVKVVEEPLKLDEGNVTSNDQESSEGSIAALFDDNLATFFHSSWTVDKERDKTFASYLEITIPGEPINCCYFAATARNNSNPAPPKEVDLYVTNDPGTAEEPGQWTKIGSVTNNKNLAASETMELGRIDKMVYTPDGSTFKYIRFCVMRSSQSGKVMELTSTDKTKYWNLAELRMYGKNDKLYQPAAPAQ